MAYPENNNDLRAGVAPNRNLIRERVSEISEPMGETIEAPDEPMCEAEAPMPAPDRAVIRDVKIKQLNFGYMVQVGCHSFAIETREKLLTALGDYMKDPQKTEKEWFDGKFLK